MDNMDVYLRRLRDKVIVDCGHILISGANGEYSFGRNQRCSEGELLSFKTGVALARNLRQLNKTTKINVCLSDLANLNGGNEERKKFLAE